MKIKKIFYILSLVFFLNFSILNVFSFGVSTDEITTLSPVALLMDATTGKVLYEKNGYEMKYPASTTKLMTAILTVENCELTDTATVSYNAVMSVPSDYTNAALQVGEVLTIEQLLHILLIPSANDAGYVLAEHIAGSTESFATMMNTKAQELGCKNTNFTNPSGIHANSHYSTAYDLALIGRYAMKFPEITNIVKKTSYQLPATEKYNKDDRYFVTTNSMIRPNFKSYYLDYVTGLKTGYTEHALDCIVATANKDNMNLICVILNAGYTEEGLRQKYLDCKTLFEFGFDNYSIKEIAKKGDVCSSIHVNGATKETQNLNLIYKDDINAFLANDSDISNYVPSITLRENLSAPISEGENIGKVEYNIDDDIFSSDLLAANNVEKSNLISIIFKVSLILLILVVLGSVLGLTKSKGKRRKKR